MSPSEKQSTHTTLKANGYVGTAWRCEVGMSSKRKMKDPIYKANNIKNGALKEQLESKD